MSEAKNTVPIHLKVTLSIKEANQLTGIGINSIEDRLREPNCPFVLFVGTKKMIKRKEFEEYISKTLIFYNFEKSQTTIDIHRFLLKKGGQCDIIQ